MGALESSGTRGTPNPESEGPDQVSTTNSRRDNKRTSAGRNDTRESGACLPLSSAPALMWRVRCNWRRQDQAQVREQTRSIHIRLPSHPRTDPSRWYVSATSPTTSPCGGGGAGESTAADGEPPHWPSWREGHGGLGRGLLLGRWARALPLRGRDGVGRDDNRAPWLCRDGLTPALARG